MVFLGFFMKNRGCIYPIFVVQLVCGKGNIPGKRQVEVALRMANNAASAKKLLLQRRKSVFFDVPRILFAENTTNDLR